MKYEPNQIYHVYNQGNNKQQIFFTRRNYLFFLEKVIKYVLPNAEILSYCLMPNHFHFQVWMKEAGCEESKSSLPGHLKKKDLVTQARQKRFSSDFAIMLRTYARAINRQTSRSGSLFRSKTKCKSENNDPVIYTIVPASYLTIDYPQTCFNYIHQNPVKGGLVKKDVDWEFSSAREYANQSGHNICNKKLSAQLGLVYKSSNYNSL